MRTAFLPAIALFLACVSAQAETCRDDILATAPDSRFQDNGHGTVADLSTGLIWKQCAEGLSGTNCTTGTPSTFTWQQALQHAANNAPWRLPNKKELASLVEQRCYNPSINSRFFPNTPPSGFWSSSPFAGNWYGAWYVSFGDGSVGAGYDNKGAQSYVRLVRGGQ